MILHFLIKKQDATFFAFFFKEQKNFYAVKNHLKHSYGILFSFSNGLGRLRSLTKHFKKVLHIYPKITKS